MIEGRIFIPCRSNLFSTRGRDVVERTRGRRRRRAIVRLDRPSSQQISTKRSCFFPPVCACAHPHLSISHSADLLEGSPSMCERNHQVRAIPAIIPREASSTIIGKEARMGIALERPVRRWGAGRSIYYWVLSCYGFRRHPQTSFDFFPAI